MNRFEGHPDWNQLAAIADKGSAGALPELLEHLAACPECMAAWGAAVEQRHFDLAAVTAGRPGFVGWVRVHRNHSRALGGVAVAALLLFILLPRPGSRPGPDSAESAVLGQLGELSQVGLVYPRVERIDAASRTGYRSGSRPGSCVDVTSWVDRFSREPADTTTAFWLAAAYLGQGLLENAEDVLRRALYRSPQAKELRHLAAITAYRRNDLVRASQDLDRLLQDNPNDQLAAFNRAVIMIESGSTVGACAALDQVAQTTRVPALRERALRAARDAGCS